MSRGLPWSVLMHAVLLTLAVMFGNTVQRRAIEPPLMIRARLVSPAMLDRTPTEAKPDPTPAVEKPPEPVPLPPKEVPQAKPQQKKPPETKPKPQEPTRKPPADPQPREQAADQADTAPIDAPALPLGASVQGTDTDFPFAWYLSTIQGQVARNWTPRQLGFGDRARVACSVHFVVARNGAIAQVTLVDGSGVSVYDREALRAVQATRLPPLPPQYGGASLGVTFIFNLEPRN